MFRRRHRCFDFARYEAAAGIRTIPRSAIPDPDDNEVWENSFVLPDWAGGGALPSEEQKGGEAVQVPESTMAEAPMPPTVRSVTVKFFKLKEHEQRRVITQMKLDRPGDRDLKDYELVINSVRRSQDEGRLEERCRSEHGERQQDRNEESAEKNRFGSRSYGRRTG